MVAIWPTFNKDGVVHASPDPRTGKLRVEREAEVTGVRTMRLTPFMLPELARRAQGGGFNPRAFYTRGDGLHPNVEGTRLAAEALHRMLREHPALLPEKHRRFLE